AAAQSAHADRYDEHYIGCDLEDKWKKPHRHLLIFDFKKETLFHVASRQAFTVTVNKANELRGTNSMRFRDFAYDKAEFVLNPLTGMSKMIYLRKPSPAECQRDRTR